MSTAAALLLVSSASLAKSSWKLVSSEPNQGNALIQIAAADAEHAWAVGVKVDNGNSTPVGYSTSNGTSWNTMALPPKAGPMDLTLFTALAFSSPQNGWLHGFRFGKGIVFRTQTGGTAWQQVFAATEPLNQLQALPGGEVFGAGGKSVVKSADGQQFTQIAVTVPQALPLQSIAMLNATCGFALASRSASDGGEMSAVLWTADGGQSWEARSDRIDMSLVRAWFLSPSLGWAAGTRGPSGVVAKTEDGGRSWAAVTMPDHPKVMSATVPVTSCVDVRFFDDKRGVAACLACTGGCEADAGNPTFLTAFMRTEDGGASWAMDPDYEGTMTAPPFGAMAKYSGMLSLAFPNPNAGFLAGQNNLVLRYTADAPEPDGWGQATCSGAGGGAGAGGGGSGGKSGVAPNFDDSGSSGCGCRTGPAAGLRAIASLLALAAAALVRAHRRARR